MTELPPRELLEKTLHESIRRARERLAVSGQDGSPQAAPKQKLKKAAKGSLK